MKRRLTVTFLLCVITMAVGCTSKRGLIELNTRPPGATVYLNQTMQGVTPVKFEYDFRQPTNLRIEKDGYRTESESLGKGWVIKEYHKGNYVEDHFTIQGKGKKAWKVSTVRRLKKKEKKINQRY